MPQLRAPAREPLAIARLSGVIRAPDGQRRDSAPELLSSLFDADGARTANPVMVAGEGGNGWSAF